MTAVALRLDRAQSEAKTRTAFEENVRLALWRMENTLAPLLARESARPYFEYSSYYPAERAYNKMFEEIDSEDVIVPSPLLTERAPYTLLHFQLDPRKRITSPEAPVGRARDLSISAFNNASDIKASEARLKDLSAKLDAGHLLALLKQDHARDQAEASEPVLNSAGGVAQTAAPQMPAADTMQVAFAPSTDQPAAEKKQTVIQQPSAQNEKDYDGSRSEDRKNLSELTFRRSIQSKAMSQNTVVQQNSSGYSSSSSFSAKPAASESVQVVSSLKREAMEMDTVKAAAKTTAPRSREATGGDMKESVADSMQLERKHAKQAGLLQASIHEGLMKPLWLEHMLILSRRVSVNNKDYVQGCLLDWPGIRKDLLDNIRDLLPQADLAPVTDGQTDVHGRTLAGLPVRLKPDSAPRVLSHGITPVQVALLIAWVCVLAAAGAIGTLLVGAVSLSERRGAFVSAVTHELRTPLTTFRMYAEMLAEGMVTDETKRHEYLTTLCAESNRLTHLVENVLSYARLERNRANSRIESVSAGDMLDRIKDRLVQRAGQAGMTIHIGDDAESRNVRIKTDASAVEQILFNLVDNACKYAANAGDKTIHIDMTPDRKDLLLRVCDHGTGITREEAKRLFRPFSKSAKHAAESAPGVGLGLALSRRLARQMGGDLVLEHQTEGSGACFVVSLPRDV